MSQLLGSRRAGQISRNELSKPAVSSGDERNFSGEIRAVRHERSLGLKHYLEQTGFTIMQSKEPSGPLL